MDVDGNGNPAVYFSAMNNILKYLSIPNIARLAQKKRRGGEESIQLAMKQS